MARAPFGWDIYDEDVEDGEFDVRTYGGGLRSSSPVRTPALEREPTLELPTTPRALPTECSFEGALPKCAVGLHIPLIGQRDAQFVETFSTVAYGPLELIGILLAGHPEDVLITNVVVGTWSYSVRGADPVPARALFGRTLVKPRRIEAGTTFRVDLIRGKADAWLSFGFYGHIPGDEP